MMVFLCYHHPRTLEKSRLQISPARRGDLDSPSSTIFTTAADMCGWRIVPKCDDEKRRGKIKLSDTATYVWSVEKRSKSQFRGRLRPPPFGAHVYARFRRWTVENVSCNNRRLPVSKISQFFTIDFLKLNENKYRHVHFDTLNAINVLLCSL